MIKKIPGVGLLRGRLESRFRLLAVIGRALAPEYRFLWPSLDWWFKDEAFRRFQECFGIANDCNHGRRWMLGQLIRLTAAVPGDTAECGVYRGA